MRSHPQRHVIIAFTVALPLVLAACGGAGGDPSADGNPTGGPATSTLLPTPDEAIAATLDIESACDLLGVVDVEVAAGGVGWGVIEEQLASCVYQDPDATHTLTLTITTIGAYDGATGESVDAGASGMIAVSDGDSYGTVWAPAGAEGAVVLTQQPALLTADAMVALTESAAISFENAFVPGEGEGSGEDGDGGEGAGAGPDPATLTGGLASVTVEGSIPSTGNAIGITVTAERVFEEGAPAFTNIACVGGSGDGQGGGGSSAGGAYAVLAMDGAVADGLRLAQLEATEDVEGPGTYPAAVEFVEADGDSFSLEGTMTIDAGLDTGSFEVTDRSGAQVVGTWECVFGD
jgi:hypothetical protein